MKGKWKEQACADDKGWIGWGGTGEERECGESARKQFAMSMWNIILLKGRIDLLACSLDFMKVKWKDRYVLEEIVGLR